MARSRLALATSPPEVIRDPDAEPRQYRDIYGLGLILYELLTGRQPFTGATARETLDKVLEQDPVSPSSLNPEVTPTVAACCLKCLRKNPWHRYARAYDLLMRLRSLLDEEERRVVPGERGTRRPPGQGDPAVRPL
jgi:serine/threonine protein kinase